MRGLAALITAVFLLSGCATTLAAVEKTPQRAREAFSDPVRRVHLLTQTGRVAGSAGLGITCAALLSPTIVGVLVCPFVSLVADFLTYEYVLEPISKDRVKEGKPSLVAPYWETGPRTDEGEVFVNP